MKRVRFIPHAEDALVERAIERDWVMQTVLSPERLGEDASRPGRMQAFRRIPQFGNRWLRVVYDAHVDEIQVVTAFFDRRARRLE